MGAVQTTWRSARVTARSASVTCTWACTVTSRSSATCWKGFAWKRARLGLAGRGAAAFAAGGLLLRGRPALFRARAGARGGGLLSAAARRARRVRDPRRALLRHALLLEAFVLLLVLDARSFVRHAGAIP